MATRPPSGNEGPERAPDTRFDTALCGIAAAGFVWVLTVVPSPPLLMLDAALATAVALIYAAQHQALARPGAPVWCFMFGGWSAAVFHMVVPLVGAQPLPGAGSAIGPATVAGALIPLIVGGVITLLLLWPYARRVLGLERRPLWTDDEPALHMSIAAILVFFIVAAIARLATH
ncbi:MAG TPA: hypothetical protein VM221_08770 [Armatimonadota bacterium]|nr:hypothetical protein [Armatimonadota bacterium]